MTPTLDDESRRLALAVFRMPLAQTIMGRKSSITNAFVSSIIPVVPPSAEEIVEALAILGMTPDEIQCAYCGDRSSEWDHLRPLVLNRRPTGFITEIANLVPSCGKCNQSKGNKPWREWMLSGAPRSPSGRGLSHVDERIERIERIYAFDQWRAPTKVEFEDVLGTVEWEKYWSLCEAIVHEMRDAQVVAETIQRSILEKLGPKSQ